MASEFLTHIFQQSLTTGKIPSEWKTGKVIPVHKLGDKNKVCNRRLILLTCIPGKLLEHIIVLNVINHFGSNNLFFENQHGCRKELS